ncbi:MAG: hypothetical protein J6A61_06945 [Clostridia bacterium]|nr:hypothetical protein [Clostridia bacterium]
MMRKGTILFLVLALILGSFQIVSAASSGVSEVISNFSIMPLSCSADSDNLVTRKEFAYTISSILSNEEMEPRETAYVDVPADDEYSGYVYYATINGFLPSEGNMFCPNDPISFHDFNAAVIKLLSYETIAAVNGGGEAGNMKTVTELRLYKDVAVSTYDTVTVKQFRKLIYNLLTADITEFNYSYDSNGTANLEDSGNKKTVLSQYFGISRYYGSIIEVNNQKQSAKVNITKNVSGANPELLTVGNDYDFLTNGKVDLNFYYNIPVELWADKDGMIIYITPQTNVEVFYDVIYSVNNDTNPNNAYALNLVDNIELKRDEEEYRIAAGAKVSYNGEIVRTPVKLAGKYAKIVLINNKVTFIETWNLQEAGMVTEVNNSFVAYVKGESAGRLKRVGEYDDIMVIIDGRSTDRTQIKPGSLFYYYQSDDLLVIVVSEKTIAGNFGSMADNEIEIGRHFYPTKEDIYVSENGTDYVENNFDRIYETQIMAYVDIFGNVRYIKANGELNAKNEFTAYIVGSSQKGFEDIKIKVQKIYPDVEEAVVTLPVDFPASKLIDNPATPVSDITTVFSSASSIAANAMRWSDKMNATDKLFKFTVNDEGVITQISEPDYYLLFGEEHDVSYMDSTTKEIVTQTVPCLPAINIPLDHFIGDYRAIYLPTTTTNGITTGIGSSLASTQLFYIRNERFVVLTNIDGQLGVMEKSYNELLAHGTFNMSSDTLRVNIAMFAEPNASTPSFWFLYGNTDKVRRHQGDRDATIDSITLRYDAEADKNYYEVVLDSGDIEWELDSIAIDPSWTVTHHRPSNEPAPDKLEVGMKVEFMDGALFCNNEIYITGVEEYPKSSDGSDMTIEQWHQNIMPGYLIGTLKKITDYRLFLDDGAAYHIGNNCQVTGIRFKNGKVEYVSLTEADLIAGSTIYFNRNMNVNSIFVEMVD